MNAMRRFIQRQGWFALGIIAYIVAMGGLLGSALLLSTH